MNVLASLLALVIAFACGSIPTAYLMGRLKGIDIRQYGSGNVGATNAFRVLGKSWGILCLLLDALKGWAPTFLLVGEFFRPGWTLDGWQWTIGLTAILGHMFSPFLGFRGGKGVATSLGVILAVAPLAMAIALAVGVVIIWWSGYVSLASMIGAALLPLLILALGTSGQPPLRAWTSVAVTALLGAMIIWKHRSNIRRLRAGTEKRLFDRATSADDVSGNGGEA